MPEPRESREEFARRGQELYERVIKPALRPEDEHKFVAIDIETSECAIDADDYTACEQVLKRLPDAQLWVERVGHPAPTKMGMRGTFGNVQWPGR